MNDFVSASTMSTVGIGKAFNAILKGIGIYSGPRFSDNKLRW